MNFLQKSYGIEKKKKKKQEKKKERVGGYDYSNKK